MSNFTNNSRNTMNQFNSNSLQVVPNMHNITPLVNLLVLVGVFVTMVITSITVAVIDKFDKRPVLPFTTHDKCRSSSVSLSPTHGNMMRRVSSGDIVIAV